MKNSRDDQPQETERRHALPFKIAGLVIGTKTPFDKFSNGLEKSTKFAAY